MWTRLSIVVVLFCSLVAPAAPGWAKQTRRQTNHQLCRRMTKQIDHFENQVLKQARERKNELWAQATLDHIDRLKNRRADKCPEWGKQRSALRRAAEQAARAKRMIATAAKAAASYFTGGLW